MFPVLATLRLSWHRSRFKHGWSGQGRHVTLRRQSDKARGMGDTAKVFTLEEQRMNSSRMMWVRLITERPPAKTTERKRYTPGKRPTWNLMAWTRLEDDVPLQPVFRFHMGLFQGEPQTRSQMVRSWQLRLTKVMAFDGRTMCEMWHDDPTYLLQSNRVA